VAYASASVSGNSIASPAPDSPDSEESCAQRIVLGPDRLASAMVCSASRSTTTGDLPRLEVTAQQAVNVTGMVSPGSSSTRKGSPKTSMRRRSAIIAALMQIVAAQNPPRSLGYLAQQAVAGVPSQLLVPVPKVINVEEHDAQ